MTLQAACCTDHHISSSRFDSTNCSIVASMLALASVCTSAYVPTGPLHTVGSSRTSTPVLNFDNSRVFKRAEFWADRTVSPLDIVNVLGRWDTTDEWKARTIFSNENDFSDREETELQAQTLKRHEMAKRMGCVERVAHYQNVPLMPFKNEALAASVGKTVEEMNALRPPSKYACNVVYDALAQSKSSLIPPEVIQTRRDEMVKDSGVDFGVLQLGIYKARFVVICSWFLFGKGQIVGGLVFLKVLCDTTDIQQRIPIPEEVQDALVRRSRWRVSILLAAAPVSPFIRWARLESRRARLDSPRACSFPGCAHLSLPFALPRCRSLLTLAGSLVAQLRRSSSLSSARRSLLPALRPRTTTMRLMLSSSRASRSPRPRPLLEELWMRGESPLDVTRSHRRTPEPGASRCYAVGRMRERWFTAVCTGLV